MKENLLAEAIKFAESYKSEINKTYAVAITQSGKLLTSVSIEASLDSACLCAETGAIAEALKLKDPIAYSLCMWYEASGKYKLLPACGLCKERLCVFGMDTMIAVSVEKDEVLYKPLKELMPYYWHDCF